MNEESCIFQTISFHHVEKSIIKYEIRCLSGCMSVCAINVPYVQMALLGVGEGFWGVWTLEWLGTLEWRGQALNEGMLEL
jgi:hypothetical protein